MQVAAPSRRKITDVRLMGKSLLYEERKERKEILARAEEMFEKEKEVLDEEELQRSETEKLCL